MRFNANCVVVVVVVVGHASCRQATMFGDIETFGGAKRATTGPNLWIAYFRTDVVFVLFVHEDEGWLLAHLQREGNRKYARLQMRCFNIRFAVLY